MAETERDRDTDFIELRETFERIIGTSVPDDALDQARRRALAVREQPGPADRAHSLALLGFATDLLVAIVLEPDVETFELARVIDQIEQLTQIPRLALAREALQAPELLRRPWPQGLELVFALLLAFTRLRAISLWSIGAGSTVAHLCHAGEFEAPIGPPRELARRILESGELELHEDPDQHALTLAGVWPQPAGAGGRGTGPRRPRAPRVRPRGRTLRAGTARSPGAFRCGRQRRPRERLSGAAAATAAL